jgi:hypothetical protein
VRIRVRLASKKKRRDKEEEDTGRRRRQPPIDLYARERRMKFEVLNSRQFELPRVTRLSCVLDREPQLSI